MMGDGTPGVVIHGSVIYAACQREPCSQAASSQSTASLAGVLLAFRNIIFL